MNEASMVREAAQARIEELEDKHYSECAQIARYDDDQNKRDTIIQSLLHTIEEQKAEIAALKRPLKKLTKIGTAHAYLCYHSDLGLWLDVVTNIQEEAKTFFTDSEVPMAAIDTVRDLMHGERRMCSVCEIARATGLDTEVVKVLMVDIANETVWHPKKNKTRGESKCP